MAAGALALYLAGCSGDRPLGADVSGTWASDNIPGDHFGSYVLRLSQDGVRIMGVACRQESGYRMYVDAPVAGAYPRLTLEAPDYRMDLEIESDQRITEVDQTYPAVSFHRASADAYQRCRDAQPPPGQQR